MKYLLILMLSICFQLSHVTGQSSNDRSLSFQLNIQHQDLPINLDVGELQTIHNVIFRPYISAEVQYNFNQKEKKQTFIVAHVGYFYNQYNSRWIATNLGYGGRFKMGKRMSIVPSFEIGIGFARDQTVQYTYENEKWVGRSTPDIMTYEFIAKPRLDIMYSMTQSFDIAFTMHGMLFSDEDLYAIPYYGMGVGLRYNL